MNGRGGQGYISDCTVQDHVYFIASFCLAGSWGGILHLHQGTGAHTHYRPRGESDTRLRQYILLPSCKSYARDNEG
jgi:hypothetical protein